MLLKVEAIVVTFLSLSFAHSTVLAAILASPQTSPPILCFCENPSQIPLGHVIHHFKERKSLFIVFYAEFKKLLVLELA